VEPVHSLKNIRTIRLLINDRPINTDNNFIPNQTNLTTKSLINSTNPTDLSSQNPNQNLTPKILPVTNVTRKDIHPVSEKVNTKLHELQIDEDTINQIQNLYIEATYIDHSPSDTSEEEFQINEIGTTSATLDVSTDSKQINVLTQDQEFILEAIKRLDDPHLQKTYLDKLLKDFNQPEHPSYNPPNRSLLLSTSINTYDLTKDS